MSDFGKDCTNCGDCVDACPYLKEFGTPQRIIEEKPESVFYCTSCLYCKTGRASKQSPPAFLKDKGTTVSVASVSRPSIHCHKGYIRTGAEKLT